MFFDEARSLNQAKYRNAKLSSDGNSPRKQSISERNDRDVSRRLSTDSKRSQESTVGMTYEMLDSANNRLQELMQILYLLSRDPAVPNDARYHVTVAQSEIALLAREIRNTAESQTAAAPSSASKSCTAAQP
jgi:hypothetical protein